LPISRLSTPIAWRLYREIEKDSTPSGLTISGASAFNGENPTPARKMSKSSIITRAKGARMPRTPIHPGEILKEELDEIGLTAKKLADLIGVPPNRVYRLLAGKRSLTADTALRLGQYFGMAPDFWMNLQAAFELDTARQRPPQGPVAPYAAGSS
jgi:addiction module HigA family antidote